MARGINKVILVGHLGADPEIKYTASGSALCTFRLATTESFNDRDGQQQTRTEWHRIVTWGKLAENCGQYLSKGRLAYVEGSIRTRSWDDNSGVKRYMTEINAREVQFLSGGGGQDSGEQYSPDMPPAPDEDIPF
ncbi:MAG: single-stranded DNA-binding protein [Desulfarculales bacterium]|jgi:single-strand DNA-binding protein|nr:single-stranded DNA-binding protein [Desulfarculales bacterium]